VKLHCPFEQELLDAIAARRWPDRAEPSLGEHVAGCSLCADVAQIAGAFFEDRDCARAEAAVPPASAVWWRAQIRARDEAARLALRPLLIVQVVATICAACGAIALAPAASNGIRASLAAIGATEWLALPPDVSFSWLLGAAAYTTLPLIAAGVWVILAPVVVYLALDE
jgi:hypothetical protein